MTLPANAEHQEREMEEDRYWIQWELSGDRANLTGEGFYASPNQDGYLTYSVKLSNKRTLRFRIKPPSQPMTSAPLFAMQR